MSEQDTDAGVELAGLPLEEAVETVLERDESLGESDVRSTLQRVAEDGILTRDGLIDVFAEVSLAVSEPEAALEAAASELERVRETAQSVTNYDCVTSRLGEFESRIEVLEADLEEVSTRLDRLIDRAETGDDIYEVARAVEDLESDATALGREAAELESDLESFDDWLTDPELRFDELEEDAESVDASLQQLDETVTELEAAAYRDDQDIERDLATVWADAVFRHRTVELLVGDIRSELDDLRAWAQESQTTVDDRVEAIETAIAELGELETDVGDRLEAVAQAEWTERYGADVEAFDDAVADLDPPVDWGTVWELLEEHQPDVEQEEQARS